MALLAQPQLGGCFVSSQFPLCQQARLLPGVRVRGLLPSGSCEGSEEGGTWDTWGHRWNGASVSSFAAFRVSLCFQGQRALCAHVSLHENSHRGAPSRTGGPAFRRNRANPIAVSHVLRMPVLSVFSVVGVEKTREGTCVFRVFRLMALG